MGLRGPKPGTQPKTPGSGRKAGTPNHATVDIKKLALQHAPAVFEELVRIATKGEAEATRVAAAREILDRAFGKAVAHIEANLKTDVSSLSSDEILQHLAALGVIAQSARNKDEAASLH